MSALQQCPSGHHSPEGQRFCLSCGWFFPAPVGSFLQAYQVLQARPLLQGYKYLYRVQREERVFALLESLEFLERPVRLAVYAQLEGILATSGQVLHDYFHGVVQSLPLLYTVFAPEYWEAEPLRSRLDREGLLDSELLAELLSQMGAWLSQLHLQKLICPGWILPHFSLDAQGRLYFLDWDSCLPDTLEKMYPRLYLGYHMGVRVRKDKSLSALNRALFEQAQVATLVELLTGKVASLWYPESPGLKSWRSVFHRDLLQLLETWQAEHHPLRLKQVVPSRIFRSADLQSALARANLRFWQGYSCYEQQQYSVAAGHFAEAARIYLNDPFAPLFEALSCAVDEPGRAMAAFEQALKIEPLSCILKERAQFFFRHGQWEQAMTDLQQAVRRCAYFPEAWFQMGQLYEQFGKPGQAEKAYLNAWNQRHDRACAKTIARFYYQQGMPEQAARFQSQQTLGQGAVVESSNQLSLSEMGPLRPQVGDLGEVRGYVLEEVLRKPSPSDYKFSTVYRARKESQLFLVKRFDLRSQRAEGVFEREAELMAQLNHAHVQKLLAAFREAGSGWLVYEYFEGQTLQRLITEQGVLEEAWIWQLLITLGSVILYLQSLPLPVIHGDIKPANILITPEQHVVLLDFESAAYGREADGELVHKTAISPPYCPPEQLYHYRLNLTSDSYALGVTLLHAMTGMFPQLFENFSRQRWQHWERYAIHVQFSLRQIVSGLIAWSVVERTRLEPAVLRQWLSAFRSAQMLSLPEDMRQKAVLFNRLHRFEAWSAEMAEVIENYLKKERSALSLFYVASQLHRVQADDQALTYARQALQVAPRFLQASWLVAELYLEKEPQRAIAVLNQSLEYSQQHYYTYLLLGRAYQRTAQYQLAIASYLQAEKREHLGDVEYELIFLYANQGFFEEAKKRAQQILSSVHISQNQRARLMLILGAVYGQQGYLEAAAQQLRQALDLDPDLSQAAYDLGLTCFRLRRFEEAEQRLRQFLTQQPEDAPARLLLARTLIELKRAAEAVPLLRALEGQNFQPAEVQFHLGRSLTMTNEIPAALAAYEKALKLKPSVPVWINLGNLYWLIHQPEKAAGYYRQAWQAAPSHPLVKQAWQRFSEQLPKQA